MKILMSLLVATLLISGISGAFALDQFSIRSDSGSVSYIGNVNNLVFDKLSFSAYNRPARGGSSQVFAQTQGNLEVIAHNSEYSRVVMNLNFANGKGFATYWIKGFVPVRLPVTVSYNYNANTGLTSVVGEGRIPFRIVLSNTKSL